MRAGLTLLIVLALCEPAAGQPKGPTKQELRKMVGQQATICGTVTTYMDPVDDCSVRLYLSEPHWKPLFYVSVTKETRTAFPVAPEHLFAAQQICVSGIVQAGDKKIPFIEVRTPSQIERVTANPTPGYVNSETFSCQDSVTAPRLWKEVKPSYTSDMVRSRLEGKIFLEALVTQDGTVGDVAVVYSDHPEFAPRAEEALKKWKFRPATRAGAPIAVRAQVEMTFILFERGGSDTSVPLPMR